MRTSRQIRNAPIDVLFGTYRRNVLALLLLHPDQTFYVREIARLTGTPAGSLHRELRILTDAGLLIRSEAGNQVRYRADRACPIFEDLAAVFRKTAGLADVLREALLPLAQNVDAAFVFGSVAQGKERTSSDVDVMVVGSVSFDEVVQALDGTSAILRRDANPVVMTPLEFRTKCGRADRFVSRIVREPKIFLLGDEHELGKLAEDRSAQGTPAGRRGDSTVARRGGAQSGRRRRR